jgi:hypothetical protein
MKKRRNMLKDDIREVINRLMHDKESVDIRDFEELLIKRLLITFQQAMNKCVPDIDMDIKDLKLRYEDGFCSCRIKFLVNIKKEIGGE